MMFTIKQTNWKMGLSKTTHGALRTSYKFVMIISVVVLMIILSACSSPKSTKTYSVPSTPSSSSSTPQSAAASTPAATPKKGGIVHIVQNRMPGVFGWPADIRGGNVNYSEPAYETLIKADPDNPGKFLPLLATSWELAPDKSSYTFRLRQGVKFSDGSDFNAEAVKFNIGQYVGARVPQFSGVTAMDIIDTYTIRFNLSSWNRTTLNDFAGGAAYIVSPTTYNQKGKDFLAFNPVGTGPFVMTNWTPNNSLEYKRFDGYWNKGLPYLDGIKWSFVADLTTCNLMFQNGEADVLNGTDLVGVSQLKMTPKNWIVVKGSGIINGLGWNSTKADSMFSDVRIRQAVEYAIDKKKINDSLFQGYATPFYQVLTEVDKTGAKPGTTPRLYDPVKAKQLLAEAGHPQGIKVKLVEVTNSNQSMWIAMQSMMAAAGIQVEISPVLINTWNQAIMTGDFPSNELWMIQVQSRATNIYGGIKNSWTPNSLNYLGVKRPDGLYDLTRKVLDTEDPALSMSLLGQIESLLYNDCTILALNDDVGFSVFNPDANIVGTETIAHGPGIRTPWEFVWKK